ITFVNTDPLPVASQSSITRTKNAVLSEETKRRRKDNKLFIRFTDVISIDPGKGGFITDYIPKDEPVLLNNKHNEIPVMKPSIASSFRINAFSDLNGFLQDGSPNGKLQTEALCIIPMRTKSTFRTNTTFFKDILPEICISKLGDDNRLLTVNVDTTNKIKYVNHFDVIHHVNFWGGLRMNVFTIDSRNTNSTFFVNFRARFMRTELADTLYGNDHLFNTLSAFYELEFYYRRSITRLFSVDISFSAGILKMYDNTVRLSYGPGYDDYRLMTYHPGFTMHPDTPDFFKNLGKTAPMFIYTPQMIIKYKMRKNNAKVVFLRMSFPNSLSVNNGYLVAQFGFSSPITSAVK
ncbi:MAG TPA: hypothetical protein VFJ43_18390, partial [Bacteroidia bacterium]|nr:hypothetical protein [Bacteroidia bacterium]